MYVDNRLKQPSRSTSRTRLRYILTMPNPKTDPDHDSSYEDSDSLSCVPQIHTARSMYGNANAKFSFTTSITSTTISHKFEHGRRYHAYQDGKYVFPNDDAEINRLGRWNSPSPPHHTTPSAKPTRTLSNDLYHRTPTPHLAPLPLRPARPRTHFSQP